MASYYRVRTKRRKLRTGRLLFLLAIFAFLLLLFFTSRYLGALNNAQDTSEWAQSLPAAEEGPLHIIIYTVSGEGEEKQASRLSLAAVNTEKQTIRLIQIPAETIADPDSETSRTLAHSYTVGGRERIVHDVAALIGVDIHAFLEVNESAFTGIAEALDMTFAEAIPALAANDTIDDYIQDNTLSLSGRFERWQKVFTNFLLQMFQGNPIEDVLNFRTATPVFATNLPWRETMDLLQNYEQNFYEKYNDFTLLKGQFDYREDGNYWAVDVESIPALRSWLDSDKSTLPRGQITIEVLNGCGTPGAAGEVAELLQEQGFTVNKIDNAGNFNYERSQVICRTANIEAAKEVAIIVPNAQFLKDEIAGSSVLVTVIVGKNYK